MSTLEIQVLHRDRIFQALQQMENYPLSVITAPMGYGKTMAVMDFFQRSQKRNIWVSLTAPVKITDSGYFWLLLTNALREKVPALSSRIETMGFPGDAMQMFRFLETLRGLPLKENVYIILDDFQYVNAGKITDLIAQVVQAGIPRLHLVLLGREYPALPVTEWEMKGLCNVLTAKTLAFTEQEAEDYLELIGFQGDKSVRERITQSSNGWIASLYLMANDYTHFQNIDHHATIYTMLRSSLYDTYSDTEKAYLMKLSLLDSFSVEQIAEIFHEPEFLHFFKRLYTGNALIFRDSNGNYHFHDLFRSFLQKELRITHLDIRPFAAQVAQWASDSKNYIYAFKFWMLAEDYDHILYELEQAPVMELFQMDKRVLKKLFSAPEESLYQYPMALLKYIFLVCMEENAVEGKAMLDRFRERCETLTHPHYSREHLLAESYVLGTALVFNDLDQVIEYMDTAAKLLKGKKSSIRIRTSNLTYGSPHMTYAYYNKPGIYRHITDSFVHRFDCHIQVADGNGFGADCVALAEYGLETGQLDKVEYWANKALFKAAQYDQSCMRICAYMALGRLYIIQRQPEKAHVVIGQLKGLFGELHGSSKLCALDCAIGYLYATLGEYERIPKWLCTGDFDSDSSIQQRLAFNYVVFGKAVILKGDYMYLDFLTEMFHRNFQSFHYQLGYIHNDIFSAICALNLYGVEYAVDSLQKAVDIAVKDQIVMPFVEYYPFIRPVLEHDKLRIPESISRRIRRLAANSEQNADPEHDKELLTSREAEIMECLAQGMSNAEIAQKLFISLNTVKRHIQNIYRKLDVPNKTMALIQFQKMRE